MKEHFTRKIEIEWHFGEYPQASLFFLVAGYKVVNNQMQKVVQIGYWNKTDQKWEKVDDLAVEAWAQIISPI